MQLVRYNPFRELQKMERDMNKFWENDWGMMPALADMSAMDLYEEGGNLVAEISLPNFKKDEVNVTVSDSMLEVSAEHKAEEEKKGTRRYYFRESNNRYFRRINLPEGVQDGAADASFTDGVLKVTMPIRTPRKAKEIAVK